MLKFETPNHGRVNGEAEVEVDAFLASALDGGEWSVTRADHFTSGREPPVLF
jgi:hypothetical protein